MKSDTNISEVVKSLQWAFWLPVAISLLFVALYQTELLRQAGLKGHVMLQYHVAMVMEVVTICFIPLSIRLFRFKRIGRLIKENGLAALSRWSHIRLLMLTVPMMVNTWLYFQFINPAFGYMAIIGLLSMMFIYPTKARCEDEMGVGEESADNREESQEETSHQDKAS